MMNSHSETISDSLSPASYGRFSKFRPASPTFDRSSALLYIVLFVGPLVSSASPVLATAFFVSLSVATVGSAMSRGANWRELLLPPPAVAILLLLATYVLANATWSVEPVLGLRKAMTFAGLIFMSFAAVQAIPALDKSTLRRAGLLFAAGAFAGALFVMAELLTHGLMTRTAMNQISFLHPQSLQHLQVSQGQITALDLDQLNRNVGFVMFNLWPGLLALRGLKSSIRMTATTCFFVTIALVVMISDHNASQVALLGSSIIVAAMGRWARYVIGCLCISWCAAFILVIPMSFALYQGGLHLTTWLPVTAMQRIIIWEYTAEQVFKHPLLGVGVESTATLNKQQKTIAAPEQPDGFVYPRSLGSHSHSIFLQTWFELGALGAGLLAIAGALLVALILRLPASSQRFAAGTFASLALVGAFSWGMWQMWFMSSAALLPLCLRIGSIGSDLHSSVRESGPRPS
jgi:O-antigen ligase